MDGFSDASPLLSLLPCDRDLIWDANTLASWCSRLLNCRVETNLWRVVPFTQIPHVPTLSQAA